MDIEDAGRLHRYRASARSEHWATALTRAGRKVCDKALPNDEARLRALYDKLAGHGSPLVVVDQPATIGALAVAVAQETGITVSYLPGLSMRRIADLTPGSAKTDAKDAAALSMLTGFDLDLARQVNQTANRIRGLHTQTPPSPRAGAGALAGRTTPPGRPVAAWPTPAMLRKAGQARIDARLKKHGCRRHATWAGQIVSALERQSVVVAGTDAAAVVLPHLASRLIAPRAQRADVAAQDSGPGGWPTLMCQVLTTRARDQGSRPPPSLLAETPTRTSSHRGTAGLLRRPGTGDQEIGLIDPR